MYIFIYNLITDNLESVNKLNDDSTLRDIVYEIEKLIPEDYLPDEIINLEFNELKEDLKDKIISDLGDIHGIVDEDVMKNNQYSNYTYVDLYGGKKNLLVVANYDINYM